MQGAGRFRVSVKLRAEGLVLPYSINVTNIVKYRIKYDTVESLSHPLN